MRRRRCVATCRAWSSNSRPRWAASPWTWKWRSVSPREKAGRRAKHNKSLTTASPAPRAAAVTAAPEGAEPVAGMQIGPTGNIRPIGPLSILRSHTMKASASAEELAVTIAELQADLASEAARADVGELVGPLIHEVTNLLNNLLLNVAVLEQGGDMTSINVQRLRSRVEQVSGLITEVL